MNIKYDKCEMAQATADGICNSSTDLNGRMGGGNELSRGLTCLLAQRYADKKCKNKQYSQSSHSIIKNDNLATQTINLNVIEFLEPIKKQIIDSMFSKSKNITIIDKIKLKNQANNQVYILEIPEKVQHTIIALNGLRAKGDLISNWLKNNKMMTLDYYNQYQNFSYEFGQTNKNCIQLLNDSSHVNYIEKRNDTHITNTYPKNYFNVGNPSGYSKNAKFSDGISLNYSVSGGGGNGQSSKKIGGWEIIGTALLTITIQLGGSGGGLCIIM
jgi:hypothetical protein